MSRIFYRVMSRIFYRALRPAWVSLHRPGLLSLLIAVTFTCVTNSQAQQPAPGEELKPDEINRWIEQLGSGEFAARERAADVLISLGNDVIPLLEKARENTIDPEIKLRTGKLIAQLRSGSLEGKIESFLAGEDVEFENWGIIKAIFGDIPKARDLYVEMLQTYPELVAALDGTPRELVLAMDKVTDKIKTNRTKFGWQPRVSDALAMLLPATDEDVPISVAYENDMLYLLQLSPTNRVPKDRVLSVPFSRLLGTWIDRSQLANRQAILYFAMEWGLDSAFPLALRTLDDTTEVHTLAHAMQVIAKHGNRNHTAFLLPFTDDTRVVSERRFVRGNSVTTQLRDIATAAIAILNDVPMKDIGLDDNVKHEKFGFIYEDVGFPSNDKGGRAAAKKKVEEVIGRRLKESQGS